MRRSTFSLTFELTLNPETEPGIHLDPLPLWKSTQLDIKLRVNTTGMITN